MPPLLPKPRTWTDCLWAAAAGPMAAFNAVNELLLPALKAAVARTGDEDTSWDGWELTPPAEDSTLSLPGELAHETTVGRVCELGPKVWLLCVHCAVLLGSCFAIAEALPPPFCFLALACLAFSAWSVLWLGSGVIESVARRHLWLRLLENGLLLQPKPAGTILDRCGSPEYRLLCCGFGLMGLLHLSVLGVEGLGAQLGNAATLLILSCVWTEWRVPSAAALLCNGLGGSVDVEYVKQLTCVSEEAVAAACAAMPLDAPTSFGALAALIRSTEVTKAAPATPAAPAAPAALPAANVSGGAAARWAVGRNWAMRFMGVPPAIALLEAVLLPLARWLRRLRLANSNALPALPVRHGAGFKAAKDRTLSTRMGLWNAVFMVTVLLTIFLLSRKWPVFFWIVSWLLLSLGAPLLANGHGGQAGDRIVTATNLVLATVLAALGNWLGTSRG
jgi:hypothetical protein